MADFPIDDGGRYEAAGFVAASTQGTVVTGSATANTKGAYAQLIASTGFHASEIALSFLDNGALAGRMLLDLAIGAAAAEQVILPNIFLGGEIVLNGDEPAVGGYRFPAHVPAGSRLAARLQTSAGGSENLRVIAWPIAKGLMPATPLQRATSYGAVLATSLGTTVDPGATANTKGAWAQLIASTTNPIRMVSVMLSGNIEPLVPPFRFSIDIGVGAAAAEVVVIHDLAMITGKFSAPSFYGQLPVSIPAGTRLAARAQCNATTATERLLYVSLLGHD